MKNIYIIHGWGADSSSDWIPWLKKESESRGSNVVAPDMPGTDKPVIEDWVSKLKEILPVPSQDTILIGHSIGCQTIMRYLAGSDNLHVGKVILVAPWFNLNNLEEDEWPVAEPWVKTPIDIEKVKKACGNNIYAIFSDNDPVVPIGDELLFKKLGVITKIYHNKGHFNEEDGVVEIPEVLELID
jgi:uncharacterized protein